MKYFILIRDTKEICKLSYYDTRLGIVNNWAASSTPGWNAIDDFALNSVFSNIFSQFGANAPQAGNSASQLTDNLSSNPFSFGNLTSSSWSFPQMDWSSPQSSGGNWFSNIFGSLGSWGVQGGSNSGPVNAPAFLSQNNRNRIFGSGNIQPVEPDMQRAVIELMNRAHARGIDFEIKEGFCSDKERKERKANAKDSRWYARGISRHSVGNAIDIDRKSISSENLQIVGHIWRDEMGFTWGQDFKDTPQPEPWHCDLRPDITKKNAAANTWLAKGGQSSYASSGYSSPWGGYDFSFPSFSSSMGGFGSSFGSDFGGNWINSMFGSSGNWGLSSWGYGNLGGGTTFERGLNFVLKREGGLANNANDKGGLTNKGITHSTYDSWRRSHGLPTQNVANITDEEVRKIYYERYWLASGADRISDSRMAIAVFDTAVNMGAGTAKDLYQRSGGDLNRFVEIRKQKYITITEKDPSQKVHLNRWLQRSELSASI